ncbi:MAG TPA: GxGYxYP family putative glycoside hydrolase [Candidatus Paceibacterota bacterium]|nr:GxGYxYP family putative glycoside hydrolase [Verrucomicrobiota bacterium]HRY51955.1 GxGYxYP family putative glycoside hydrolase [Candidatus Paceibacterota bacterium]
MWLRIVIRLAFSFLLGAGTFASAAEGTTAGSVHRTLDSTVLYTYDARTLRQLNPGKSEQASQIWDTWHALTAIQGLANRERPRLYVFYCREFGVETDVFWLNWLREEDGWLRKRKIVVLSSLDEVIQTFRRTLKGLAVYDPAVPATANVASTAAGCDRLLPVRYDPKPGSLYLHLTQDLGIPVRLWLVQPDGTSKFTGQGRIPDGVGPSTGSAKADAYRWAAQRYLDSGQCAAGVAAYYVDAFWIGVAGHGPADLHTLSNHDFFIARRGFFFDLSCWKDEAPNDDPAQPLGTDHRMLLEVMHALHRRAQGGCIQVGGFTPWPFKYTDATGVGGRHGGVPTEWEFSRLISQFNGYLEADAAGLSAMANASFFTHYPLKRRYPQPNSRPTMSDWKKRGFVTTDHRVAPRFYVGHYVGDYDAPAWLYKAVPAFFQDPARGRTPLGWAFNPNLANRAPQALVYAYRHARTNDFFITGDSGAGYVNPRALTVRPDSGLPSGWPAWAAHCRRHYGRWDMTITGFMLDGSAGASTELEFRNYAGFSPDGLGTHFEPQPALRAGVPTCPERDLPDDVKAAAALIVELAKKTTDRPGFLWARSILKSPRWYAELSDILARDHPSARVTIVDPYTFFGLIRINR